MKKFNFKKIAMMSLAAMMAVSAMSISAFAADTEDTWEQRLEEAEYGSVDSLDELNYNATIEVDGDVVTVINNNDGIMPLGSSTKPSTIAGSTDSYWYGSGNVTGSRTYLNQETSFSFNFTSSCTTSTAQYAEFVVGALSSSQKIYLEGSGGTAASVNISLVPMSSSYSTLGPKTLAIRSSNYESISFNALNKSTTYAIKVTPVTAGKAISGVIKVAGTDF